MNLKIKRILLSSLFATSILGSVVATITLTSCTNHQSSSVIRINNEFLSNENQWMNDTYKIPMFKSPSSKNSKSPINELYTNAVNAVASLEKLKKEETNLSVDENIWLDSFISQWKTKIGNIENGIIYLGSDPIAGTRMLSSRANHVSTYIKDAINIYQLDSETGDPDTSKPDANLIKTINNRIDSVISYINHLYNFLVEGMNNGVMPSNLTKKSYIKQMIEFFYIAELNSKLTSESLKLNVEDLFSGNKLAHFDKFKDEYLKEAKKINHTNNEIETKLNNLVNELNKFMKFYSTEYYTNANSYGFVPSNTLRAQQNNNIEPITLSKTNNDGDKKEIDESLLLNAQTNVYGLGYSNKELTLNNIGIGFMKPVGTNIKGEKYVGNNIYTQQLINNNSTNTSAVEINQRGIKLTADSKNKMISIAKQVVTDILKVNDSSTWDPEIEYTNDPFKVAPTKQKITAILGSKATTLKGDDLLLAKFNIWLNQEDFFFGREKINSDQLVDKYWKNADSDPQLKKYKEVISKQGYQKNWENATNINGSTVTVAGNNALAGAVSSLESYTQFKESTDSLFAQNFNKIQDYVLSPYNYEIRKDIGVGMEGPRGSKQFQYNCDPYYSLQKWSVASLTVHEGAMGHHTQQQYWTEYMPGSKNGTIPDSSVTPGYTFENDSFHEGWAVFTEWFAAELGTYGTWGEGAKNDGNVLPTNWTKNASKNLNIQDVNEVTNDEIEFIKNYQSGVYWNIVNPVTEYSSDSEKAVAATKLANMLAYYGYLNEAQLRNMRLALDTSVHYNGNKVNQNGITFGASIQDERNYMQNNSGLGIGDINSESVRYMTMPSQATGYMLGKIIINDLYDAIKNKYSDNTNFVVDKKDIIIKFFDLVLRNGEIPLNVLQEVVKKEMKL